MGENECGLQLFPVTNDAGMTIPAHVAFVHMQMQLKDKIPFVEKLSQMVLNFDFRFKF